MVVGGWGKGNLTDTAIQTLTYRRFKIPGLKIDDEQHIICSSELSKLTDRSFKDFPLRYMRGDSLKNSLSRCWFCIRCH